MFNQIIFLAELGRGNSLEGDLPALSFAATGYYTPPNTLAGDLPLRTLTISGSHTGISGSLSGNLPIMTGSFTGAGGGTISGELPLFEGELNSGGSLAGDLPLVELSITGSTPQSASLSGTLPLLTGSLSSGGTLSGDLPSLGLTISGASEGSEQTGVLTGTLPRFTGAISGASDRAGSLSGALPKLTGSISGAQEGSTAEGAPSVGSLSGDLPLLTLTVSASPGVLAALSGDLPLLTFAASGGSGSVGSLTGSLPLPELVAYALGTATTLAVNVATGTVTEYENFPFTSYAGEYAAGPGGLYRLAGDTDAGAAIEAWIDVGPVPLAAVQTYVPDVFVNGRVDGELELLADVDEERVFGQETYLVTAPGGGELCNHRIPMARGVKGMNWHFRLRNVAGGAFDITGLEIVELKSGRRAA